MAKGISLPVTQSGLEASIQQGVKNVGKVNIPVNVDPSAFKNLAQPLGRVSGLATEFEKSIAASNARVLAFGASVGIINGVQNAFADLVRTGIDVQKTLADIAAISGKGGTELSKFGDALFDVAKNTSQSFKTASQAALEFSRQGLSTEETLKRTNDALTLTRFTTLNAAEAVDVLTAAANSFADTGITTAQIINKLVAVDTKFAVSAEDLANGLARAGSIAQEVGVSFDELNAAVTITQERTARGGAVIGNALKTIFTRLRSDETVQALRDIGVESLNAQGELKGAIPILQEVAAKIQGLGGGERVQILEAVASKYNINILSALLDDLNNANSKFGEAVAISAGANNQAYERQIELNKTLAAQINGVTVSVTQLFNKLAEIGVTENLNSLLKFVNDLLGGFNKLLDSEGTGANIAKGIIKGLSDVFFTVGLPIIGAIFVKLTKDVAQFGVESLKTILGINQQVRERQALEQAVVNTLIRDQEVMATILALSGNRAKQEEYLLGIYNRQLAALQQVQSIASSVTPALMAGGLSATSGQIKKRAAGGYLPAQEAADIRRGVGGANSSARVVSIPNFAFGGGKRGTMVANTSEYIVPNFANGGSAIFNKDMVKAYGLPIGARKISAAGGYIPNFAKTYNFDKYAGLFGVTSQGGGPLFEDTVVNIGKDKNGRIKKLTPEEGGVPISFDGYGVPSRPGGNAKVEEIQTSVEQYSKKLARDAALDFARAFGKPGLENEKVAEATSQRALSANQNKGAIAAFTGSIFEAAVSSILDDRTFQEQQERATTSLFDFENSPNLQTYFNIPKSKKYIEAKNTLSPTNVEKIAAKIFKAEVEGREKFSQVRAYIDRPDLADKKAVARTFNEGGINYIETENNKFARAGAGFDINRYRTVRELPKGAIRGAMGYIPNFAKGGPLEDAIGREMAAGLNPSQIRVTKDGRLRNSQNPNGLAVINTRDEPNGKIPNFVDEARQRKNIFTRGDVQGPILPSGQKPVEMTIDQAQKALGNLTESSKKTAIGLDKMFVAMSATMMATSTLEATLGKTDSEFGKAAIEAGRAASSMAQFASLGALIPGAGPYGAIAGAAIGLGMYGYQAATEPERMAKEQRQSAYQQELNPEGDLQKQIDQTTRSINVRAKVLEKAQKDANKYMFEYAKTGSSSAGNLFEEAKQSIEEESAQVKKLQELLEKLYQTDIEGEAKRSDEAKKAQKELKDRVALSKVIGELNISYAKGEAASLVARTARYATLTENATKLTETEIKRTENALKVADIEEKINNVGTETLHNLIKQVADKSKLATITQKEINLLKQRYEQGDKTLDLETEARKLGIEGASNLQGILDRSIEQSEITKITLKAQKDALETQIRTEEINNRNTNALKNKLALLNEEFNITNQIEELRTKEAQAQGAFERGSAVRNLRKQISGQAFATPQQQARLDILQEDARYTEDKTRAEEDYGNALKANFIKFKSQAMSSIQNNAAISPEIKAQTVERLKNADSAEKMQAALKELKGTTDEDNNSLELANKLLRLNIDLLNQQDEVARGIKTRALDELQDPAQTAKRQRDLLSGTVKGGMYDAFAEVGKESAFFSETFGKNTTLAFRDGLRDALSAAVSQTDDLNGALQNVAMNFLKTMQNAFLQQASNSAMTGLKSVFGFAKGGLVTGGSGYRDDVPAMLTGGEFVMRKSAVQKYGAENLRKMNDGGIFLPGVRGGGAISGYDALRAFANQTTTSGSTDILRGGRSSAFINLEDQSARLSRYALLGDDTINQEIRSAQEQGLNIIQQREAYRTQQRKAFQQQLVGTIASAALSAGIGALARPAVKDIRSNLPISYGASKSPMGYGPQGLGSFFGKPSYLKNSGGLIRGYASGGPVDDVPALLMSGEYVMNRQSSSKYGKRLLDSMNQGRLPRFADGGEVGRSTTTTTESNAKMMGDVSININVSGQTSQTEAQGNTNVGGIDYKKMSERIKAVVIETINEEKRLGGSLRSR